MNQRVSPEAGNRPTAVPAKGLEEEPAVEEVLAKLSLGSLGGSEVFSFPGRNENWSGVTDTGNGVFIKRLTGREEESRRRFRRVLAFEEVAAAEASPRIARPPVLGWDEEARLLVFALLSDCRSGSEIAAADEFSTELAEEAGKVMGSLHELPAAGRNVPQENHPFPPVDDLAALPLSTYAEATGAFIQAWSMLQRDKPLLRALKRLRASETDALRTPVHGDMRLDQFLVTDGALHLTDWEEFRLADPARDVGAFVGEWLHRAVLRIPVHQEEDDAFAPLLTHADILERGDRELRRVLPLIEAFWSGYRTTRAVHDPGLALRATAHSGWHLIDRLLASTRENARLSAIVRAAAGIGRTALLDPASFTAAVGLKETP